MWNSKGYECQVVSPSILQILLPCCADQVAEQLCQDFQRKGRSISQHNIVHIFRCSPDLQCNQPFNAGSVGSIARVRAPCPWVFWEQKLARCTEHHQHSCEQSTRSTVRHCFSRNAFRTSFHPMCINSLHLCCVSC